MKKEWKIVIFILGMVIGIGLLLLGIVTVDDIAHIRLEGSEL